MKSHPEQRTLWPARTTDPTTSHEAAAAILDKIPELERVVRDALVAVLPAGMTITETATWLGLDRWSVSPRFRPLARKRLIFEAGFKVAPTGRRQIVWKARVNQSLSKVVTQNERGKDGLSKL